MKKIFSALVLLSILVALFLPMVAAADVVPTECIMGRSGIELPDGTMCPDKGEEADIEELGTCCLLNTLYNITDWIFVFLLALATVFVIIGAVFLLTAAGIPDRIITGRNYIIYAILGLVVGFFAKAVPFIIKLLIGIPK